MAFYETTFITRPDLNKADVQKLTEEYTKIITDNGGKVARDEYWGLRSLAYKIQKNGKGHYVMLSIDSPFEAVAEMERQMRINEDVVRVLTVKVEALEDKPSVMMRGSGDDEETSNEDEAA